MGALTSGLQAIQTLTSSIGTVTAAANAVQGLSSFGSNQATAARSKQLRGQQELALKQLQQQQNLQLQNMAQDAALDRSKTAADSAAAEEKRRAALKRAVARQRTSFASQGVGSGAGSSQAVLLGLFDESDDERETREKLDGFRSQALDQEIAQRQSLNVLQRTQLQEKQSLDRIIREG